MTPTALVLSTDLLLGSRVTSAARRSGLEARVVRQSDAIVEIAAGPPASRPAILVADLSLPGAIDGCVTWSQQTGRPAVGYCAHVATDLIRAARLAGVDTVLVHSQLAGELPELFEAAAAEAGTQGPAER